MVGDLKEAAEVYEHGQYVNISSYIIWTQYTVLAADPSHRDAKMELAKIYEILNEPRKALDLVMQGTPPALIGTCS